MDLSISPGGQPTGRRPLGTEVTGDPPSARQMDANSLLAGCGFGIRTHHRYGHEGGLQGLECSACFLLRLGTEDRSDTGGRREAHTPPALQRRSRTSGRSADAPRQRPGPLSVPPAACDGPEAGAGMWTHSFRCRSARLRAVPTEGFAPRPGSGFAGGRPTRRAATLLRQLSGGPNSHSLANCGVARFRCVPPRRDSATGGRSGTPASCRSRYFGTREALIREG